jgi:hypothetical protein
MDIAIKCADISNPAKSRDLSTKWAERIMEEFFLQGDEERKRGLPISMFMDRQNTNVAKCQIAFIDYIVKPLYEAWDSYMNEGGEHGCLAYISENREYWKGSVFLLFFFFFPCGFCFKDLPLSNPTSVFLRQNPSPL